MLDESLGKHTDSDYTIEFNDHANPYNAKSFSILKIHEAKLKKESHSLVNIGAWKKINSPHLVASTLIIP